MAKDELSGADIKAVCTEAGLLALRERRMKVPTTALSRPLSGPYLAPIYASSPSESDA